MSEGRGETSNRLPRRIVRVSITSPGTGHRSPQQNRPTCPTIPTGQCSGKLPGSNCTPSRMALNQNDGGLQHKRIWGRHRYAQVVLQMLPKEDVSAIIRESTALDGQSYFEKLGAILAEHKSELHSLCKRFNCLNPQHMANY